MTVRVYIFAADTEEPLEFQLAPSVRCSPVIAVAQTVGPLDLLNEERMWPLTQQIHHQFKDQQDG
ncbi:MAG TPA: hypothetical protein VF463_08565 [Sphingobium sp.]